MDTIKNFLEEKPLYSKLTGKLPEHNYQLYPGILMLDCSICKGVRPFHKPGYGKGIPFVTQGVGPPPGAPESFKTSIVNEPVQPSLRAGIYSLAYECTGCLEEKFWCWIEVNTEQQWIRKIGQVPPWSKSLDKNLAKLLASHQDYYRKGLACESHGYGIGASTYYRRIVEEIIDELLALITDLIEPNKKEKYLTAIEETKKTIVAQEKSR
jgi:hypothetical protein